MDQWEEGLDEDSPPNKRTQRTNYERFIHHACLSDEDIEEDHVNVAPIDQFKDGEYKRQVVTNWDEWDEILAKCRRARGLKEQDKYDLSEEEFNCHGEKVRPRRKDFGHITPDEKDLHFKCHYLHMEKEATSTILSGTGRDSGNTTILPRSSLQ